jgi:hypothetical protein
MEKLAVLLFVPYFLDALLYFKARVVDKAGDVQAFAKANKDNSLDRPYLKIYDSTHLAIAILKKLKGKVFESDVVLSLLAFEVVLGVLGLLLLI